MTKFDEVVSLGYNCEISFRIRDYLGSLVSWPFSWSYILDRDLFLESFDDLKGIFQGQVSISKDTRLQSMIQCDKYKICFHPRAEFLTETSAFCEEKYADAVAELKKRVAHLTEKFENLLLDNNKKTLFLVGITDNGLTKDEVFIKDLYNLLKRKYKSGNFVLVAVVPKAKYTKQLSSLESENLKVRKIKKFGVQKYNDILTDSFGWAKIFSEFLGIENIPMFYKNLTANRIKRVFNMIKKRLPF